MIAIWDFLDELCRRTRFSISQGFIEVFIVTDVVLSDVVHGDGDRAVVCSLVLLVVL